MFCSNCGAQIDDQAVICIKCGCLISGRSITPPDIGNTSSRSRLIAFLLAFFVGVFGVHRFYLGRTCSGVAMIFTFGGLGIWAMIDWIVILCGAFKDDEGKIVSNWDI